MNTYQLIKNLNNLEEINNFKIDNKIKSDLFQIEHQLRKLFDFIQCNDKQNNRIFSNSEYVNVYTLCYNISTKREQNDVSYSKLIYELYEFNLKFYLELVNSKLDFNIMSYHQISSNINTQWSKFTLVSKWLSLFFSYLDRYYTKVNLIDTIPVNNYRQFYLEILKPKIPMLCKCISESIDEYRINKDNIILENIVKLIDILKILPEYEDNYKSIINSVELYTKIFYKKYCDENYNDENILSYVHNCDNIVKFEVSNKFCLEKETIDSIKHIVLTELLYTKSEQILNHTTYGIFNLLKSKNYDYLLEIYKLYINSDDNLKVIKNLFSKYLELEYNSTLDKYSDLKKNYYNLITDIYDIYDKYINLINRYLLNSNEFQDILCNNVKNIFNIEIEGNSLCYYLVLFINNILVSNKIDDKDKISKLDTSIVILKNINDKDLFLEHYKHVLASRLLSKNIDLDLEKNFISKIKIVCGGAYTSKLETMIKDYIFFKEYTVGFNEYLKREIDKEDSTSSWFNTYVLTQGIWPTYKKTNLILPSQIIQMKQNFENYYNQKYNKHKLTWCHHKDDIVIDRICNKFKYNITCNIYQAITILLFNQHHELDYIHISENTNIDKDVFNKILHSLSCTKYKILNKTGNPKSISTSDIFSINYKFSEKIKRIKLLCPNLDTKKNTHALDIDRTHVIDAYIVRIMKSRKVLNHTDLITQVMSQIHMFKAEPKVIKKRIESLIEREFIERESTKSYKYIA